MTPPKRTRVRILPVSRKLCKLCPLPLTQPSVAASACCSHRPRAFCLPNSLCENWLCCFFCSSNLPSSDRRNFSLSTKIWVFVVGGIRPSFHRQIGGSSSFVVFGYRFFWFLHLLHLWRYCGISISFCSSALFFPSGLGRYSWFLSPSSSFWPAPPAPNPKLTTSKFSPSMHSKTLKWNGCKAFCFFWMGPCTLWASEFEPNDELKLFLSLLCSRSEYLASALSCRNS